VIAPANQRRSSVVRAVGGAGPLIWQRLSAGDKLFSSSAAVAPRSID
jgi:hypothetical protein